MKITLIALPLAIITAGCNSPDADLPQGTALVDAINSNAVSTKQVALDSQQVSQDADKKSAGKDGAKTGVTTVNGASGKTAAKGGQSTPDPKYKVVDETNPGMPPEVVAALKKVQVPPPPANMKVPAKARVRLVTSKGSITVELNGKEAPLHVKSFLYLSQRGFFNGTVFHRYEPGFVIQGGDPLTRTNVPTEYFGQGGPGYQIPREDNSLRHGQYVLAAARTSDPNSAGSQFYITLKPTTSLDKDDPNAVDPYGYTVFGKVVEGQANVLKLDKGAKLTKAEVLP